ncbi:nuclear transport factor 2 family protein [Actinomadura roseirufa]|uniref:nuclear transport factor 2 family protein n=1 Tax=Actinomadura roseirufa TaxID=2094049 RepID=UPI001041260F|nr:nuclear transport factor 2 family protein [Actinomadura roseirufa]
MPLTAGDRAAIADLIARHGHLVDAGELDRLGELFTEDVVYDVTDLGAPPIVGLAAVRDAALALGAGNPVAHHVTNVVVTEAPDDRALVHSKGLGIGADGSCASVTYEDTVVRLSQGWRIAHRRIEARRTPLSSGGRKG